VTHLLLVRHGLNDAVGKRLAGRNMDVHLNAQGQFQAQQVAAWLAADKKITAILTSPITRAVETAQPLAALMDLPIHECEALIEVNYGDWSGKTFLELEQIPEWKKVTHSPEKGKFPNGESFIQIANRLRDFLTAMSTQYGDEDVVACFSHADIAAILLALSMGLPLVHYQRISISPGSVSAISSGQAGWRVHFINLVPGEALCIPVRTPNENPISGAAT
jgi:probable phosphoglycerate mutase